MLKHLKRVEEEAVSPVIAVILLLAITVVLASVLYIIVSNLAQSSTKDVVYIGVVVETSGPNWTVRIVHAPTTLGTSRVELAVSYPNGTLALVPTPLSQYSGFIDTSPEGTLNAGDRILLPKSTYPIGSTIMLMDEDTIMCTQKLGD